MQVILVSKIKILYLTTLQALFYDSYHLIKQCCSNHRLIYIPCFISYFMLFYLCYKPTEVEQYKWIEMIFTVDYVPVVVTFSVFMPTVNGKKGQQWKTCSMRTRGLLTLINWHDGVRASLTNKRFCTHRAIRTRPVRSPLIPYSTISSFFGESTINWWEGSNMSI